MKELYEKLSLKNLTTDSNLKYWSGRSIISSNLVGKEVSVYNGKVFKTFKVLKN